MSKLISFRFEAAQPSVTELPRIIPIFPLPNLVLFPGCRVPLRIFEPRYRQMIADVADAH